MQTDTKPELVPLELRFNPDTGQFEAWGQRWQIRGWEPNSWEKNGQNQLLITDSDPDKFRDEIRRACLIGLEKALEEESYEKVEALLKTLPYPQDCQCESYPNLVAHDCHVHNDRPMHFFGDFEFPCTCSSS